MSSYILTFVWWCKHIFTYSVIVFNSPCVYVSCYISGVLNHLMALERGMRQQDQHQSERLEMLKVKALTLRAKRDQLKRQTDAIKVRLL